jgi:hypothetical protein
MTVTCHFTLTLGRIPDSFKVAIGVQNVTVYYSKFLKSDQGGEGHGPGIKVTEARRIGTGSFLAPLEIFGSLYMIVKSKISQKKLLI